MTSLPAFFQGSSTTVLEELVNFELGGLEEAVNGLVEEAETEEDLRAFDDDAFGDLKEDSLPAFFATPKKAAADSSSSSSIEQSFAQNLSLFSSPPPSAAKKPPSGLTPVQRAPPNTPAQPLVPPAGPWSKGQALLGALRGSAPAGVGAAPPLAPMPALVPVGLAPATPGRPVAQYTAPVAQGAPLGVPPMAPVPSMPALDSSLHAPPQPRSYATLSGTEALSRPYTEQQAAAAAKANFGRGKCMSASDVRFVVGKVLQPLQSSDAYSDDFYFLQYNIKKNLRAREQAAKEMKAPPPVLHVPLPAWRDTKERIRQQLDLSRKGFESKVKQWEEEEQVLGHRIRPEVSKPREQLSIPSIADMDFDLDQDDDGEFKAPFSSRLWTTRLAVQQGYEALYTLQELQHLLSHPSISANPLAVQELRTEMDSAVALLSQSLGIRMHHSLSSSPSPHQAQNETFSLDGRHIAAILQTAMGKKLLARGLKLLPMHHRWSLVPVVLARLMAAPVTPAHTTAANAAPSSSAGVQDKQQQESVQVERALLKTLIEFLQYSFQHQQTLKRTSSSSDASKFTDELLGNLRQCLKNVLVTLMEKNTLRESLLSERTRAEIMNVIVEIGDQIQPVSSRHIAEEWEQTREAFMSVLEN